jgi:hypoxanthine phosphoribosyltransferase
VAARVFNYILATTTIIGFGLALWQAVRMEQLNRRNVNYNWPRFLAAVGHVVDDIRRSGFEPQIIICLSDRAAIFAHLIEKDLPSRIPVVTAVWDHRGEPPFELQGFVRIGSGLEELLPEALAQHSLSGVLVVDDYTRSGRTMRAGVDVLVNWGFEPTNIRTAAVVTSKVARSTGYGPDFFDAEVEQVRFLMPWGRVR